MSRILNRFPHPLVLVVIAILALSAGHATADVLTYGGTGAGSNGAALVSPGPPVTFTGTSNVNAVNAANSCATQGVSTYNGTTTSSTCVIGSVSGNPTVQFYAYTQPGNGLVVQACNFSASPVTTTAGSMQIRCFQ